VLVGMKRSVAAVPFDRFVTSTRGCETEIVRGDERWDESWHRLRDWTGASGAAERLAAQILLDQGFTDIDPSHPLGGRDGKADALARRDGRSWVMAVYFPRGQQTFTDIKEKFVSDFDGVATNPDRSIRGGSTRWRSR